MKYHTCTAFLGTIALMGFLALPAQAQKKTPDPAPAAVRAPGDLFEPIAGVVMGPRCINCHMMKAPHQKDTMITHAQLVVRGKDGKGTATLQCISCHQAKIRRTERCRACRTGTSRLSA